MFLKRTFVRLVKVKLEDFNTAFLYTNYLFKNYSPNQKGFLPVQQLHIKNTIKLIAQPSDIQYLCKLYLQYLARQNMLDYQLHLEVIQKIIEFDPQQAFQYFQFHQATHFFPPVALTTKLLQSVKAKSPPALQKLLKIFSKTPLLKVDTQLIKQQFNNLVEKRQWISAFCAHQALKIRRVELALPEEVQKEFDKNLSEIKAKIQKQKSARQKELQEQKKKKQIEAAEKAKSKSKGKNVKKGKQDKKAQVKS